MIITIRHKALAAFYSKDETKGLPQKLVKRIAALLPALDAAEAPEDLNISGLDLHPLKGNMKGYWAVSVSGNWRLIFRFEEKAVHDLDLIDYH